MLLTHIARADLNLLRLLHVLLEERHVSRAAERCFLSQPAMSRALGRLRSLFQDELLIRRKGTFVPTAKGDRLLLELEELLPRVESMLRGNGFDPASSRDRFRLTMTDHASVVLLSGLVERVNRQAPGVRIEVLPWSDARFEDVESGRLDLVTDIPGIPATLESQDLYADEMVCMVGSRHPLRGTRVQLKDYLRYPHAVVNVLHGQQTPVDQPLSQLGKRREAGLVVGSFVAALLAIPKTKMILTVPGRWARRLASITQVRTLRGPRELQGFRYQMGWHPRLTADPAHQWFRDQLAAVAKQLR
jgi:DNA-binding transcriptional LysR family regulator